MLGFDFKIRHDKGLKRLLVAATDQETAIGLIMDAESCPRSAIIEIKPMENFNRLMKGRA